MPQLSDFHVGQCVEAYRSESEDGGSSGWKDALVADLAPEFAIVIGFLPPEPPGFTVINGSEHFAKRVVSLEGGHFAPTVESLARGNVLVLSMPSRRGGTEHIKGRIVKVHAGPSIVLRWQDDSKPAIIPVSDFESRIRTDVPDLLAGFEKYQKVDFFNVHDDGGKWVAATVLEVIEGVNVVVHYEVDDSSLPLSGLGEDVIKTRDGKPVDPNKIAVGDLVSACYDDVWWDATVVQKLIGPHLRVEFGPYNVPVPASAVPKLIRTAGGA